MPKRKREDIEGEFACADGDDNLQDSAEDEADNIHHAKRKLQILPISSDTSTASAEPSPTISCTSDGNVAEVSTATATSGVSSEPSPPTTNSKTVADVDGDCKGQTATATTSIIKAASVESPRKKRVRFDGVTVYYFHRSQGFSCVPTTGGNTLGMSGRHHTVRRLTLIEHEVEQKFDKRRHLTSWHLWRQHQAGINGNGERGDPPGTSPFYSPPDIMAATDHGMPLFGSPQVYSSNFGGVTTNGSGLDVNGEEDGEEDEYEDDEDEEEDDEDEDDDDDDEEEEEVEDEDGNQDNMEEGLFRMQHHRDANCENGANSPQREPCHYASTEARTDSNSVTSTGNIDSAYQDEKRESTVASNRAAAIARAELPLLDDNFLQPLGNRERRSLLRDAGVHLDSKEKGDCHSIRLSRQVCGCDCRIQCLPDTCACARDNIKCQVDRPSFPCGCTKQGCMNPHGRVEFNPLRVRTHYLHTMMRLKMENRRQQELPSPRHLRFTDDNSYADFRDGDEVRRSAQVATSECLSFESQPQRQQASSGFPAFHTLFSGSTATTAQAATISNDGSYWRLDSGASAVDSASVNSAGSMVLHQQSKNSYSIQHLGATTATTTTSISSWGCGYRAEDVGTNSGARHQSYCASMALDNGLDEVSTTTNGCFDDKAIYICPPRQVCTVAEEITTSANETTMYSLASLYSHQPQRHYGHNNGSGVSRDLPHSLFNGGCSTSDGIRDPAFQEFSSASYPNYGSSSFTDVIYHGDAVSNHADCVIYDRRASRVGSRDVGELTSAKMANGELGRNGMAIHQRHDQNLDSESERITAAACGHDNGSADSSDSSDGSCAMPASPPPPELGAVLKKSICETALA